MTLVVAAGCNEAERPSEASVAVVQDRILTAFTTNDTVRVIVGFRDPRPGPLSSANLAPHREAVRALGEQIARAHAPGFVVSRSYNHLPALAGSLSRAALDQLAHDPNVSYVQLDGGGGGALKVAVPAIGGDKATAMFGVTGKGVRVAVLDTGVSSQHPDLVSSILPTQHCFTQSACPPNNTAEGTSAEDDNGHGSNVTGIVTSDGVVAGVGFAPSAGIVAVKVDDRNDRGFESDWAAGLDWVFQNLATLQVKIVNLSIVTDTLYTGAADCDAAEPALAAAVKNLTDAGVTIFAAAGNQGSASQVAAPACNSGVIAVGATYKSSQGRQPPSAEANTFRDEFGTSFAPCFDATTAFDQVACFSNSNARVDMVAPGAVITADYLGTQTGIYRGTSQASPAAAGVAALMLECDSALTPAGIKSILQTTSVQIIDGKNGRSFASIRALAAVLAACAAADGGAPPAKDAGSRDAAGPATGTGGAGGHGGSGGASAVGTGGAGGAKGTAGAGGAGGPTGAGGAGGAKGSGGANGAAGTTGTTRGGSSGCSCSTLGEASPGGGAALFAIVALALAARPRARHSSGRAGAARGVLR